MFNKNIKKQVKVLTEMVIEATEKGKKLSCAVTELRVKIEHMEFASKSQVTCDAKCNAGLSNHIDRLQSEIVELKKRLPPQDKTTPQKNDAPVISKKPNTPKKKKFKNIAKA